MFRIDDNLVVDATMKGNAARFINHSCDVCMRSHFHPILQRVILTIMFLLMFLLSKYITGTNQLLPCFVQIQIKHCEWQRVFFDSKTDHDFDFVVEMFLDVL